MGLVLVLDCAERSGWRRFWAAALRYRRTSSSDPYVVLVPNEPGPPELVLQRVFEPKTVKNRMHLDIRTSDIEAESERLIALGAGRLSNEIEEDGFPWYVLADPERNEFCVCAEPFQLRLVLAPEDLGDRLVGRTRP